MKITEVLTKEELAQVTSKSDLRGAWMVLAQWGAVIGIFAIAAIWEHWERDPKTGQVYLQYWGYSPIGYFAPKAGDAVGAWSEVPPG